MLAVLGLSWSVSSAQQFSTCNSPNVTLALVEVDKLGGNCTNSSTTSTTYHTYSCLTAATAVISNCQLTIKSGVRLSPTNFPCYAVDFVGSLTAADKASLAGSLNDPSAQLSFCAKNTAVCATLLQQSSMAITFTRNGDSYTFSSGGCDYKYQVTTASNTLMVASSSTAPAAKSSAAAAATSLVLAPLMALLAFLL